MNLIEATTYVTAINQGAKEAAHYHNMAVELNIMDDRKAYAIADKLETRSQMLKKQRNENIADLADGIENMSKENIENLLRLMFSKMA